MSATEHFRLNGVDVGFAESTDVSVRCGRVRMRLRTPAIRLTRELDNGLSQTDWKPIANAFARDGLTISPYDDFAVPRGEYGCTFTFPYTDESGYLQRLLLRAGPIGLEFFGMVTIKAGWLIRVIVTTPRVASERSSAQCDEPSQQKLPQRLRRVRAKSARTLCSLPNVACLRRDITRSRARTT
jgi:hypothetical protein